MSLQDPPNNPSSQDGQCWSLTAKGERCKNPALPGQRYCQAHFPKTEAESGGAQGAEPEKMDRIALLMEQILAEMIAARQGMDRAAQSASGAGDTALLTKILAELVQMRLKDEQERQKEPAIDFPALFDKLTHFLEEKMTVIARRIDGDYEVDKWGRDMELVDEMRPFFEFMYEKYWRVTTTGLENVPAEGKALLVANHSGVLPWDGAMVITAVAKEHPQPRLVRALHLTRATEIPIIGLGLSRLGQVQALPENAERLLKEDELALVFPEGVKGVGKPFSERYRLARFGRGGFVRVAIRAGAPIIPVSIVGAEEIYPNLANMKMVASAFNLPYFPATPTFPWLGPLGVIPLPTKWTIRFHKPIQVTDINHRPAEEPLLVSKITNQVRDTIQKGIYDILKKRKAVFW
ncbi:phospholipid/glycerol acyltransferase [Desulfatibacillum aliphaticivorans]|uniref:Phospholipid/glycerol acyltransferase n=1 Tax=Desulfatibacillum aliphaticivorans TaxID=218208 RepID=B8FA51_DESAL|nr:1-acyl-sn-glycerol-3-phosphate acyltransferase [Desulfatibacillum aliphaticivorans]ACL03147.1 phospholipid/glycerol acyltransferase [Desulfatibacillum aliphaticivorans]